MLQATGKALLRGMNAFANMSEPQRLAFFLLAHTPGDKETRHLKVLLHLHLLQLDVELACAL